MSDRLARILLKSFCVIHFPEQTFDTRAVIPLRDDARKIDDHGIQKHDPRDERRRKKPKDPERNDRQPVRHLGTAGFDQILIQVFFREIKKPSFGVPALFPNRASVRQKMFPAAHAKNRVVDTALFFETVSTVEEAIGRKDPVRQAEAHECSTDLKDRPNDKTQNKGGDI